MNDLREIQDDAWKPLLQITVERRDQLGFFGKLPYLDPNRFLFAYLISGLFLFIFGGLTGLVNASYQLNNVVHNTAWMPGHFHMTVAGPVFLAIIGMSTYLFSKLSGKRVFLRELYRLGRRG